jgi:hypothetical protein
MLITLALGLLVGALVDWRLVLIVPISWLAFTATGFSHYRARANDWERVNAEAQKRDKLSALDILRDRRAAKEARPRD